MRTADKTRRRILPLTVGLAIAVLPASLASAQETATAEAIVTELAGLEAASDLETATLRQQARNRRLPPAFSPLATAVTSRRIRIDFDRFDLRRHPPAVRPPTFVVHSVEDTAVPISAAWSA